MNSHKNASNTKIIIDCQILQTADRNRGMGLFLYSLLLNLFDSGETQLEWIFLLNSRLPDIRRVDKDALNRLGGHIISGDFLHRSDSELFEYAGEKNRNILDDLLSQILNKSEGSKNVFLIPALFSRDIYPVFPTNGTTNTMIFYDIIPYLYPKQYFRDYEGAERKDYAQRFREFYKTDTFMTISQTTADDLSVYFGVDPKRIVTILGAGADRSSLSPTAPKIANKFNKDFILMPSGDDYRKNNSLAARAFDLVGGETKLVITSKFSKESQDSLLQLCSRIIFTENVSDEEYLWLVDNARAVFFPTEYEGLGMPILEAVQLNKTVVCSSIPVFTEISRDAFVYFDPKSISSMKDALELTLNPRSKVELDKKKTHYKNILSRFSWDETTSLLVKAILGSNPAEPKKRLAVFCPSPSSYSAIGKYAFELHAELSRVYEIDYYAESGGTKHEDTRPNILEYASGYYPASSFDLGKANVYDYVLYNIGNSEFHTETILNSLRIPGTAIVHDTKLNGIFDYMQSRGIMSSDRKQFEILLDRVFDTKNTSCLTTIITNQKSLICHSVFAKTAIRDILEATNRNLMEGMLPVEVPTIELIRPNELTISFAGIIAEEKGINLVAEISKLSGVRIKVFGYGVLGDSPLLQDLGQNVEVVKDLSDKEFQDQLRMSDIVVNYRVSYQGETSLSTLEAMRYGAVVIVRKIGWFDELPDDAVVKVDSTIDLIEAIQILSASPQLRKNIANAARLFLKNNFSHEGYVKVIKESLEKVQL